MRYLFLVAIASSATTGSCFVPNQAVTLLQHLAASVPLAFPKLFSITCLFATPEPLASEGAWSAYLDDEKTGLIYYFNDRTGESRWVPPTRSFPSVELPRDLRRKAEEKQREYRESVAMQLEENKKEEKKSFVTTMLEPEEEKTKLYIEDKKEDGEWFSFLKDHTKDEQKQKLADSEKTQKSTESDDWFSWGRKKVDDKKKGAVDDNWFNWFNISPSLSKNENVAKESNEKKSYDENTSQKSVNGADAVFKEPPVQEESSVPAVREQKETATATETEGRKQLPIRIPKNVFNFNKLLASTETTERTVPTERIVKALEISAYLSPDPKKVYWGGEDALFVKGRTFGVFDGVTGADKLEGRSLYSKTIAQELKKNIGKESITFNDMYELLGNAVEVANVKATGATTAIVASVGEDDILRVLNVGDSTCLVIRNERVLATTKEQNHFFECPYQFSNISPDRPRDGTRMNVELVQGDIVVMGSDGVFDNLFDEEIIGIATSNPNHKVSTIAKRIVDRSRKISLNSRAITPFAKLSQRMKSPDYPDGVGGKVDDACCIVMRY